ncbi:hypothetical protein BKA62DRAFT_774889 [Auriculariales sp. MPI-PUGE-AT-0066]|nr:hypothetical protein BKA62DRAFT_774889 [Auriculariales sp. MPI-PUGE-AT-0066]
MREEAALNDAKDNEPQPKRVTAQHILSHLFSETGIPLHALLRTVQLRRQVAAGIQPERLHEATGHTTYFCLEGEYFQGNLTSPPLEQLPAGQDWGGKGLHTAELRALFKHTFSGESLEDNLRYFVYAYLCLDREFVTEIGKASVIIVGDGTSDARREALAGLGATVLAVDAVMAQILEKDDQLPRLVDVLRLVALRREASHKIVSPSNNVRQAYSDQKNRSDVSEFPPQATPLPTAATYTLLHLFLNTVICVL